MMAALLRNIRRRSLGELSMLGAALALRAVLLAALRVVSFARLQRVGPLLARSRVAATGHALEQRVGWAVATAGVLLPAANSCLADALAAHWLLAACGCRSTIRYGVVKTPAHTLRAHAWVEAPGGIIVGAAGAGAFTVLERSVRLQPERDRNHFGAPPAMR